MRCRFPWGMIIAVMLSATCSLAGETLSIRLVEATNKDRGAATGIDDVVSVLKSYSRSSHHYLTASSSLSLPAKGKATDLDGYVITCKGKQTAVSITVRRGKRQLLKTTFDLRDNKPVIMGGLGRNMILVFMVK